MGNYYHCMENPIKISMANVQRLDRELHKTIYDLAHEQDFEIFIGRDPEGNVDGISFQETKRYDDAFFVAIAPYASDGSYIQVHGDCGSVFRLMYHGGVCHRVEPIWIIPQEDANG